MGRALLIVLLLYGALLLLAEGLRRSQDVQATARTENVVLEQDKILREKLIKLRDRYGAKEMSHWSVERLRRELQSP